MLTLKSLKEEMRFNIEILQIIEILKSVASTEFRHLQETTGRSSEENFSQVLEEIAGSIPWKQFQDTFYLKEDTSLPFAFVALGTDEGFSGGLNSAVMTALLESRTQKEDEFLVLGERAARYLEEARESFVYFGGISKGLTYQSAEALANSLWVQFKRRKWGKVFFVYSHFISLGNQEIRTLQVLPYKPRFLNEEKDWRREILLEPSLDRVAEGFIRWDLILQIKKIFHSSKLSEFAARVVHLEGSSHQLSKWQNNLRLRYFRGLHELRDRNIREIFASKVAK